MIRHITVYMIQDKRSKLWYHHLERSWVDWEHASLWHTRRDLLPALGTIDSWNRWCCETTRKPTVRSFDTRLDLSIP